MGAKPVASGVVLLDPRASMGGSEVDLGLSCHVLLLAWACFIPG